MIVSNETKEMEERTPYITPSSGSNYSILAFPPPLSVANPHSKYRMTTYARPGPSLIDTLPVEILSHILTLATYTTSDHNSRKAPEGAPIFNTENVKMPLLFSSVSRYWRRVARNTPSLWSSLCITLELVHHAVDHNAPSTSTSPSTFSTIDTRHLTSYLALSRQYPIDILIDARDHEWDFQEDEYAFPGSSFLQLVLTLSVGLRPMAPPMIPLSRFNIWRLSSPCFSPIYRDGDP